MKIIHYVPQKTVIVSLAQGSLASVTFSFSPSTARAVWQGSLEPVAPGLLSSAIRVSLSLDPRRPISVFSTLLGSSTPLWAPGLSARDAGASSASRRSRFPGLRPRGVLDNRGQSDPPARTHSTPALGSLLRDDLPADRWSMGPRSSSLHRFWVHWGLAIECVWSGCVVSRESRPPVRCSVLDLFEMAYFSPSSYCCVRLRSDCLLLLFLPPFLSLVPFCSSSFFCPSLTDYCHLRSMICLLRPLCERCDVAQCT